MSFIEKRSITKLKQQSKYPQLMTRNLNLQHQEAH
jgi:hypothetical protein